MAILWKGRLKNCIMMLAATAAALLCSSLPVQAEEQTEQLVLRVAFPELEGYTEDVYKRQAVTVWLRPIRRWRPAGITEKIKCCIPKMFRPDPEKKSGGSVRSIRIMNGAGGSPMKWAAKRAAPTVPDSGHAGKIRWQPVFRPW